MGTVILLGVNQVVLIQDQGRITERMDPLDQRASAKEAVKHKISRTSAKQVVASSNIVHVNKINVLHPEHSMIVS